MGLKKRETLPHPDIGYAFLPQYWQKGYALEGAKALLKYTETVLKIDTVIAITSLKNTASQNLLEKLGMQFAKTIRARESDAVSLLFVPTKKNQLDR